MGKKLMLSPDLSRPSTTHNSPIITNNTNIDRITYKTIRETLPPLPPLPSRRNILDSGNLNTNTGNLNLVKNDLTQSLRCKSSYSVSNQSSPAMAIGSPSLSQRNNLKRLATKRFSSAINNQSNNSNRNLQKFNFNLAGGREVDVADEAVSESNYSATFFQSADSEFTFVNSRATVKPDLLLINRSDQNRYRRIPQQQQSPMMNLNSKNFDRHGLNGNDRIELLPSRTSSLMFAKHRNVITLQTGQNNESQSTTNRNKPNGWLRNQDEFNDAVSLDGSNQSNRFLQPSSSISTPPPVPPHRSNH